MSGPVRAPLSKICPRGTAIPEAILDCSEYRVHAGRTGPSRLKRDSERRRAKRSQFSDTDRDGAGEGSRGGVAGAHRIERTQFAPSDRSGRGRARSAAEALVGPLYKQTQFAGTDKDGHGPERRWWSRRSGRLRQTNPICPAPAGKTLATKATNPAATGDNAPNKANFRVGGPPWARAGKVASRHRQAKACETKPIPPKRHEDKCLRTKEL